MRTHGVGRQLGLVALADQHAEGALALPGRIVGRRRKAALEHRERRRQLPVPPARRRRGRLRQLGLDPALAQPPRDALGAPAVERAAVLGEPRGEPVVAERAERLQPGKRLRERRLADLAPLQMCPDLRDCAIAGPEVAQREVQRVLDPRLPGRALSCAQAACSSGTAATGGASPPPSRSIGFTSEPSRSSAS